MPKVVRQILQIENRKFVNRKSANFSLFSRLFMGGVFSLLAAEFLQLQTVSAAGFFVGTVVAVSANRAFQPDIFAHRTAPYLGEW